MEQGPVKLICCILHPAFALYLIAAQHLRGRIRWEKKAASTMAHTSREKKFVGVRKACTIPSRLPNSGHVVVFESSGLRRKGISLI
jgi:hypothetical protein